MKYLCNTETTIRRMDISIDLVAHWEKMSSAYIAEWLQCITRSESLKSTSMKGRNVNMLAQFLCIKTLIDFTLSAVKGWVAT